MSDAYLGVPCILIVSTDSCLWKSYSKKWTVLWNQILSPPPNSVLTPFTPYHTYARSLQWTFYKKIWWNNKWDTALFTFMFLKVLKKNPSTVWSNYLILKFGWHYSQVQMNCGNLSSKKLKKYSWILLFTQHYYCRKKIFGYKTLATLQRKSFKIA